MKKTIITTIFALFFGMTLSAQNDGFFTTNYDEYCETTEWGNLPTLPGSHGLDYDYEAAPLGSGLLLLGGWRSCMRDGKRIEISCQLSAISNQQKKSRTKSVVC